MSALGHKQTFLPPKTMSALPLKADIRHIGSPTDVADCIDTGRMTVHYSFAGAYTA